MTWRAWPDHEELARSTSWDDQVPGLTVVVASCDRAGWLPELFAAVAAQTVPVELVVVDDASRDATPEVLRELVSAAVHPALALRTRQRSGPSAARNAGAARGRGSRLLFTDDDCLPAPTWAAALAAALAPGVTVAQGSTSPVADAHGPWDRSITVARLSGLYETCNLGVDAAAFREAGGFADLALLSRPGARGFGEDAELGAALARAGSVAWAPQAEVRHRWVPGTFADHLEGRRRLAGFPQLVSLVPEVEQRLVAGAFLSRRTLAADAGLLAVVGCAASPWSLVALVPWLLRLRREARHRPGRHPVVRMAQLAVADAVGATALARGSLRARRPVL